MEEKEPCSGKGRRPEADHSKFNDPIYKGSERRSGLDRRSGRDRRPGIERRKSWSAERG